MKKITFAFLMILLCCSQNFNAAVLIGHRGSYWGVENTEEAFRKGAQFGYNGLETDIKVTSDTKFVCCHDDDLSRFGHSSANVASSTLAQLKALQLSQTRGGQTYTATICTLEEYLDICKEYDVFPVIELKWATGINSNDCSNLPALVEVVRSKGMFEKAIFLTSMKPCLEFIRTNYPTATIQLLCYANSMESNLQWCINNRADIDVCVGPEFTANLVKRYHDNGLLVNVWTINTVALYQEYRTKGCDMFTTDYLDLLGILEPDDEVRFVSLWTKTLEQAPYLTNTTSQRSMAVYNGELYIPDMTTAKIAVVDGKTGDLKRTIQTNLDATSLSCIRVTHDGVMLLGSTNNAQNVLTIYRCDENGVTNLVGSKTITGFGQADYFDVYGNLDGSDGGFIVAASNQGKAVKIPFSNGVLNEPFLFDGHKSSNAAGTHAIVQSDTTFFVTGFRVARKLLSLDGKWSKSFSSPSPSALAVDGVCFALNGHEYYGSMETRFGVLKLFDITHGLDSPVVFDNATEAFGSAANTAITSPVCVESTPDNVTIYVLATNNGIAAYRLQKKSVGLTSVDNTLPSFYIKNGAVVLLNAVGEMVSVYDIMGRMLISESVSTSPFAINRLPKNQSYIIKVGDTAFKTVL